MLLSRRLLDVAHRLGQLGSAEAEQTGTAAAAHVDDPDVVPIEQLLLPDAPPANGRPIVPIETLAPDDESLRAGAAATAPRPLETTFRTYTRLRRERPPELPSLTALLRPHAQPEPAPPGDSTVDLAGIPVPIGELCYQGPAALQRAEQVRQQLAAALAGDSTLASIRPLLDELLDLVPLALTER